MSSTLITKNVKVTVDIKHARSALIMSGYKGVDDISDEEVFDLAMRNGEDYGVSFEEEKSVEEVPETLSEGREIRNKVIDYIIKARIKHPEIKDDVLYKEGAVIYSNSNDGTSFDWEMNHCTCDFVITYQNTGCGFIRAWVNRDGYIKGYLYLDEGRSKAIELEKEYIGVDEAKYFASLLYLEADKKKIWDKPITEINFDRKVKDDELLRPVW